MAKATVKGQRELRQNFSKFVRSFQDETIEAMRDSAERILDEAVEEAPRQTGALQESGRVERLGEVKQAGFGAEIIFSVAFGGDFRVTPTRNTTADGRVDYAAIVHELNHPYLLIAIQNVQNEIEPGIRERLKSMVRKTGTGRPG